MPRCDDDVLASARQRVGFVQILHVETWGVTSFHQLPGIIVAVETKFVVLAEESLAILKRPSAAGKESMLAVRLVPEAHLNPCQKFILPFFIDKKAVSEVNSECFSLLERKFFVLRSYSLLKAFIQI